MAGSGLRQCEEPTPTARSQPKSHQVGNAGGKPRGPRADPTRPQSELASVSLRAPRAGWVGPARAARAGRAVSGPGRIAGPAGPRTRRLSPRFWAADTQARPARLPFRLGAGPGVLEPAMLRAFVRAARPALQGPRRRRPPPRPRPGHHSRGPRERHLASLCPAFGPPSIHLFIPASFVQSWLPRPPRPRFLRLKTTQVNPGSCPPGTAWLAGAPRTDGCEERGAPGFCNSRLLGALRRPHRPSNSNKLQGPHFSDEETEAQSGVGPLPLYCH